MKGTDSKEKSSVYYIGKGVIILCIITASSLGFLLGFFVGKNMQPPVVNQAYVIAPPSAAEQKNADPLKKEAVFQQQTQETQQSIQPQGLPVSQPTEEKQQPKENKPAQETTKVKGTQQSQQPKVEKSKIIQETQSTQKAKQATEPGKTGETKKTVVAPKAEQTKESERSTTGKETGQATKPLETKKTKKYVVQAGAFKSASDANALKAKLNRKRYKASVILTETKKHEKLYKVVIGEFTAKPEAELLSVKIKKAEGLHTFVTVKD